MKCIFKTSVTKQPSGGTRQTIFVIMTVAKLDQSTTSGHNLRSLWLEELSCCSRSAEPSPLLPGETWPRQAVSPPLFPQVMNWIGFGKFLECRSHTLDHRNLSRLTRNLAVMPLAAANCYVLHLRAWKQLDYSEEQEIGAGEILGLGWDILHIPEQVIISPAFAASLMLRPWLTVTNQKPSAVLVIQPAGWKN